MPAGPAASLGEAARGYVVVRVSGPRPDALLRGLVAAGIPFRQARHAAGGLRLRLAAADFRRLRAVVRRSGVRVHIVARGGWPFLLARAARRPALLAAALAGAAALYVLSGFVWFVQVRGTDRVAAAEVARAAAELGLRPGVWKAGLDPGAVADRVLAAVPGLSWVEISLRGTLATIQVVERARPGPALEQAGVPGDLVASHAGIVRGVSVSAGAAAVVPGQRVEAGQVLIRGLVQMPVARTRQSGPEGVRQVAVHAAGIVLAVQTYQAYAESPASIEVGVPTGRVFVRRALAVAGRTVVFQGLGRVPFADYGLERRVAGPLRWRGVTLPFEVLTLRYAEVSAQRRTLAPGAAGRAAAAEARAFLIPQLPAGARIIQERHTATLLPGGRVGVELWVESEDNIGVFRPARPSADLVPSAGVTS